MARVPIWKSIRDSLSQEISQGAYLPGAKLPTEAELAVRFSVNRHTVRRALGDMAQAGIVRSRRGAGVFVKQELTDFPIGKRVRFHQNLQAAGRAPDRSILALQTRRADADEAEVFGVLEGVEVIYYSGVSYADRAAIILFENLYPADRFPDLIELLSQNASVSDALQQQGVSDYTRTSTRISAQTASPSQAQYLKISDNAPLLCTLSLSVDPEGRPVEYSRSWFAADRVTLTLDLA